MFQNMIPALTQIDSKVLIVLACVAVVLFIISLVKKAVKAGIFLLILALLLGGGVPTLNHLRESYSVTYNQQTETLAMKVSGKTFTVPIKEIKAAKSYSIKLDKGNTTTKVSLFYQRKDGTAVSEAGSNSIAIPNFMIDTLKKYLKDNGLSYTTESSETVSNPEYTQ